MSNGPEQRRQVRLPADHHIRFTAVAGPARAPESARMVDVSEGGMCFVAQRYLPPGTSIRIEFGDCRLVAQVRHCRLREYGAISQFFTGVQVHEVLEGTETWTALTQAAS
jgi:c-di-GMP-binding flagellar brake protein YcgR